MQPRALDPVPSDSKKNPPAHEIFKNLSAPRKRKKRDSLPQEGRVSFQEYEELLADRPQKLTAEQVNYRKAEGEEKCRICIHFFTQGGGERRNTCEIFRPENEHVDSEFVCDFVTSDGKKYPLLDKEEEE
jgi:hypothetical protein